MRRQPDPARHPAAGARRSSRLAYLTTALALAAAAFLTVTCSPSLAAPAAREPAGSDPTRNDAAPALALVVGDRTPLRDAPRDSAPARAELTQGDLLEVRGQRLDHLLVYDRRRERGGFVRADAVRRLVLPATPAGDAATADELLAVLRFLREAPGQEALGIAYAAAYLQATPAARIDAEPFDAIGTMAERLARRASAGRGSELAHAQTEAVGSYGVRFTSLEREGRLQLCYDGEAFRRALALRPDPAQQARAILALTRHDCVDPQLAPAARVALDDWRAELLDRPWPRGYNDLPAVAKNRLHLRRAGVWAARAHQASRQGLSALAAAQRALAELATVDKGELTDDDRLEYAEAAIRVGAVRWAAAPAGALAQASARGLRLVSRAGAEPGQTCVQLFAAEGSAAAREATAARKANGSRQAVPAAAEDAAPVLLAERCTFGTVWAQSLSVRPSGDALTLAVQPLEGWTELWVFRAAGPGGNNPGGERPESTERVDGAVAGLPWRIDTLPPAPAAPGLGYVEFAGWVPGAEPRLLVARESRTDGRFNRRFEVLSLETLDAVKQASTPTLLAAFGQWGDAQWRRHTVALR